MAEIPLDSTNVQLLAGLDVDPEALAKMVEDLRSAINIQKQMIASHSKAMKVSAELFEQIKAQKLQELEILEATGRDTYVKMLEIEEEQDKFEFSERIREREENFAKYIGAYQKAREEMKKNGTSAKDEMGETYELLMEEFANVLSPEKTQAIRELFEKRMTDFKDDGKALDKMFAAGVASVVTIAGAADKAEQNKIRSFKVELEGLNKATKSLITNVTGIKDFSGSFLSIFRENPEESIEAITRGVRAMFSPLNIAIALFSGLYNITKKLVVEMDALYANYSKAGGLIEQDRGGIMGGVLEGSASSLRKWGIGKEASVEAGAAFHSNFAAFSTLSDAARESLTELGAELSVVGVSAQTTGALLNTMVSQYGWSTKRSEEVIRNVEEYGRSIEVSSSKMMKDMAEAMPRLAMFGEKAVDIIKELAREAKKAGVEVGVLVGLEEKFLTFDNSAELVGKMNALAGRVVLDPMQFMMATGDEKIQMAKDAIRAAGVTGPRDTMFVANALGISPGDVQKLINEESDKAPDRKAADLKEVIQMSLTMGQKLKVMLENIAVAAHPILYVLQQILTRLTWIMGTFDGLTGKILIWGGVIALVKAKWAFFGRLLKNVGGIIKGVISGLIRLGKTATVVTSSMGNMASGVIETTTSLEKVQKLDKAASAGGGAGLGFIKISVGIAIFAAAMALLGVAAIAFAYALSLIIDAMKGVSGEQVLMFSLGLVSLGVSMVAFSVSMAIASLKVMFGLLAFFKLSALLYVLGETLPNISPHIKDFAENIGALGEGFRKFMKSMVMESGSSVWNAIKGFFGGKSSGNGFSMFISLMETLSETIGTISVEAVLSVDRLLSKLMSFEIDVSKFKGVAEAIYDITAAIDAVPEKKFTIFTEGVSSISAMEERTSKMTGMVEAVNSLTESKVEMLNKIVKASEDLSKQEGGGDKSSLLGALGGKTTQQQPEPRLVIKLDSREIANAILPIIKKDLMADALLK